MYSREHTRLACLFESMAMLHIRYTAASQKVNRKAQKFAMGRTPSPARVDGGAPRNSALQRLLFRRLRAFFVHEWDVVGCEDSRDVADHDACNAFNWFVGLVIYPRHDR
jgi:hypothetical protein